jgi:hypothetical protein
MARKKKKKKKAEAPKPTPLLDEHKRKEAMLERGVSPDGLPINPRKTNRTTLPHGWYRYEWYSKLKNAVFVNWFRVGPAQGA